jgi:hypothetical protein
MDARAGGRLPFDLRSIRAIPYELKDGRLPEDRVAPLIEALRMQVVAVKIESKLTYGSLFQLVPGITPLRLPHEVTESFRDRARAVADVQRQISEARGPGGDDVARAKLPQIEEQLRPLATCPPEIVLDLILAFCDASGWDDVVRCIEASPADVRNVIALREQLALALNRRRGPGDRRRTIEVLDAVTAEHGESPETLGIRVRDLKDDFLELRASGQGLEAAAALEEAIDSYVRGFEADPRDYYPGINAIPLSLYQDDPAAVRRIAVLTPVVTFAVARRGSLGSEDYWDVATAFELAAIAGDWATTRRGAGKLSILAPAAWMIETTLTNLRLIKEWHARRRSLDAALDDAVAALERRPRELKHA